MTRKADLDLWGGSTMSRKFSFVTVVLAAWAALLLVLLLVGAPALAHHKEGHDNGPPSDKGAASRDAGDSEGARSEKADSKDAAKPDDAGKPSDAGAGDAGGGSEGQAGGGPSAQGGHGGNPPGNNGTVKIHELNFDSEARRNMPHVGCVYELLYFGGDSGQELSWTFWGWAPTGGGELVYDGPEQGTLDADGYGRWVIDMTNSFDGIEPHPQQGYHVKLDVATGEPGGQKHKVFWVDCQPEVTQEELPPTEDVAPTVEVRGDVIGQFPTGGAPERPDVLGKRVVRGQPEAAPEVEAARRGEVLPFTGGNVIGLLLLVLGLMTSGGLLVRRSR